LKRFDLNLNLKGCFEKGLKKKRKKRNSPHLPFAPVAQQPINPSPAAAHGRHLFFFFLSFADDPALPVSDSLHLPFIFPPPLPRLVRRCRDPRRARPLAFPFLLARAGQLRRHLLAFKSGRFTFSPLLPEIPAAFNGKRRQPLVSSASLPFPFSQLQFKVEPELLLAPLISHCKHTHLRIPFTIAAASVRLPPQVKENPLRPFFFLF
jgi:hypothetical protein